MNKYDVLGVVGEGAYGVVLKCKNRDTGEVVAIKKFKESEEDEIVRKTTLREVKILRIMRHENIVQLKEAFRRKGKLYLVFEFVEKSMLDILEANPNGVDQDKVRLLTYQLSCAINYCHRHDVIHRDIKPENLLINPVDLALRLCDFGFARQMAQDSPLTDYVATRWYRAPELLLGSTDYGKDVDIWALGCIMGELTDGQPLFAGESEVDQLFVIQKVLGPLTAEHMEMFLRNPRFMGIQFPHLGKPTTLEHRYKRRMSNLAMNLLKGTLMMEPRRRLTSKDLIRMPVFEGIKLPRSLRPPSQTQSRNRPDSSSSVSHAGPNNPPNQNNSSVLPKGSDQSSLASSNYHGEQEQPEPRGAPRAPDPRQMREDPRLRDEGRMPAREDARFPLHEDSRTSMDHRGGQRSGDDSRQPMREDPRLAREDPRMAPREETRLVRGEDLRLRSDGRQQVPPHHHSQHQNQALPQTHHHSQHQNQALPQTHQYMLPWESTTHRQDTVPEPSAVDYSQVGPGFTGEPEDKDHGRRSRQGRRGDSHNEGLGCTGDWGGNTPSERLQGDHTPTSSQNMFYGLPPGTAGGGGMKLGRSGTGGFGMPPGPLGPTANSSSSMFPGSNHGCGSMTLAHPTAPIGPPPGTAPGGSRAQLAEFSKNERGDRNPMGQLGVSAGTGGSEEWPSTQNRGSRQLREQQESDDDRSQGLQPGRRKGRQPAPAPPTRRSPDPEPWQESRHQAWDRESADVHSGLPSIHTDFLRGPQGFGPSDTSSRAASRITTGTPTPREEDSLDYVTRQHVGHGPSMQTRWTPANADWPGIGPPELGPVRLGGSHNTPHGPPHGHGTPHSSQLHEVRTPQHERGPHGGGLGGLRRTDLSGVYHGHVH